MSQESSWTAYLSDGRSINEKDLYTEGEKVLPFKKLIRLCKEQGVKITSMTLNIMGVRFNSPSFSSSSNFNSTVKPEKFWISYKSRFLVFQTREKTFMGMSWKVGDFRTTLWVTTSNPKPISWFEIREAAGRQEELIDEYYEGTK